MSDSESINDSTHVSTDFLANPLETLKLWTASSWFAYLTILLLQLKRVWAAWQYRDLTPGDTSHYFLSAYGWAEEFSVKIHWSPLYTAFYGTLFKLVPDVYWATILHRFVIVFALTVMILALMRRLLPAGLAWLITAWWVIMPINFDSLYEVHLFAILLPLACTLLVLYKPGIWSRGAALGILSAATLLVRNEIILSVCLWGLACLIWEIHEARLHSEKNFKIYILAYGVPILFAVLAFGFFSWRTLIKPTPQELARKHTLNVCQIYAFGYQQRHPAWTRSPWRQCQELMLQVFGEPEPSMLEAIRSNPPAMLKHFLWNVRLLPAGLQVALFNATSGHINPDYTPIPLDRPIVLVPSFLAIGIFVLGMLKLHGERHYWWRVWLRDRIWGWILLFCLSAVMIVVIPMQRPRPSYMFLLTLSLMAALGMGLTIIMNQHSVRHVPRLISVVMIAMPIFIPSYYSPGERPLLNMYQKLAPYDSFIGLGGTGIVSGMYAPEICNYFTKKSIGGCIGYRYDVFRGLNEEISVSEILDQQSVPIVALILEESFWITYGDKPSVQTFLANPEQEGWKLVSVQNSSTGRWRLYLNLRKLSR